MADWVNFDRLDLETLTEIVLKAGGSDRGDGMDNAMQLADLGVGDNHELLAGSTKIQIELGESRLHWYENVDTESTIVVTFNRKQSCSQDESLGGLLKSVSIVLTAEEWRALSEQLNGPLNVLLERKPYHADLT